MANQARNLASRTHSKFVQGMTTQGPKDKLCMGDSGTSLQESSRTDSGFLSGGNLLSDQNLSSDDLSTPVSQKSAPDLDRGKTNSTSFMRLDSGVDVSLNDQFSCLSLHKNIGYNDLSCSRSSGVKTDSSGVKTDSIANVSLHNKPEEPKRELQPWELYYQQDEDGDTWVLFCLLVPNL